MWRRNRVGTLIDLGRYNEADVITVGQAKAFG